jgi:2-keto-4-pentenoate hydratase
MKVEEAIDILWDGIQQGAYFPAGLKGQLTLDEAYRAQLGVLARHLAAGQQQAGWKIALAGTGARQAAGVHTPAFGYLLASGRYDQGQTFQYHDIPNPAIESELLITLGHDLQGPGVTRAQALEAAAKIVPAFELVSIRGSLAQDLPLGIADNIAQWGFVVGDERVPYPKELDLADVTVEIVKNGTLEARVRGGDAIDDPLDSIAWLANELAPYGVTLAAGHSVLTGAVVRPLPIAQGDRWETHFSSVGTIRASFV